MPTVYIGMGGNLPSAAGPPQATLAAAAARMQALGRVLGRSSLYSTEPVDFAEQPRFVNAVLALETDLTPHALLHALLAIEKELGRDRAASFPNGPRTLDLDILLFGKLKVNEPGLILPHPRIASRAFVVIPLSEVARYLFDHQTAADADHWLQARQTRGLDAGDAVVRIQSDLWHPGADGDSM